MSRLISRLSAVAAGLLLLTATFVAAGPAAADAWGKVDCTKTPSDPRCVITVGTSDAPGSKGTSGASTCKDGLGRVVPCFVEGAGWYGGDGCYYQLATGADLVGANALGVPTPPAAWYVGVCGYPPVPGLTRLRVFGAPPGPQLLADEAVRALRLPTPVIRVNPAPPYAADRVFPDLGVAGYGVVGAAVGDGVGAGDGCYGHGAAR